ncbi:MAG: hypothetical protein RBS08_01835 [Bdellovibrionales bacterium]|jgi:hypothetical protein|nr:hypothetical protein [Bdellovibrionales bacterium]
MADKYKKLNDYTLEVVQGLSAEELNMTYYKSPSDYSLTRIFNFGAGQVTTLARHSNSVSSHYSSNQGAGIATSVQMHTEDFQNLPSTYEVELMHKKLTELGGKPPPLETTIRAVGKKPAGLGTSKKQ